MIQIAITGIPGSGKTFLIKKLEFFLNNNGYKAYSKRSLILLYMSNYSQITKIASVFFPKKVSSYISYKLFNKYRNEILEKSGYNKPNHFIRKLCLIINSEIHDEVVKDDILRWIENTFLYEYMAGKCLKSDHIYLVDEGFFHRIISIFSKDVSPEQFDTYFEHVMLPNMLLRIIIDKNEALRRIEHRGKVDVRPKTLSYLNDSDILIDQAINHINGKKNKVKIIDLDGENQLNSNLEIILNQIKKYKIDTSS